MTRLPRVTAKEIIRVLERIGFSKHHPVGSHAVIKSPDGKRRVVVAILDFYISRHLSVAANKFPKGARMNGLSQRAISPVDIAEEEEHTVNFSLHP